jgi:hypothetical protein
MVLLSQIQPGVTKANCDRIKIGMNAALVRTILGLERDFIVLIDNRGWSTYHGEGGVAHIEFKDGVVVAAEWSGPDESFIARIRGMIHLR